MGCACTKQKIEINPLGIDLSYSNKDIESPKNKY